MHEGWMDTIMDESQVLQDDGIQAGEEMLLVGACDDWDPIESVIGCFPYGSFTDAP